MVELLRWALRREMPSIDYHLIAHAGGEGLVLDLCIIPLGHALPASWIFSGLANVDSAGRIHRVSGMLYASKTSFILFVWPSICGWKAVDIDRLMPRSLHFASSGPPLWLLASLHPLARLADKL
jgi:hypothetical protein